MGFFTDILNGGRNKDSAAEANKYLNQIPGKAQENLNPYINPGEKAGSFVEQIMKSYKPSAGYQFQKEELGKELSNNAAAGGFSGTQYDQGQRGKLIQALLSGDMQQYFNNVNSVHNKSFDASRELNDIETGALNQQGGLAFGAAESKNARNASLRDALLGLAGTAAGAYFGGPMGAAMGSKLGGGGGGGSGGSSMDFVRNFNPRNTLNGGGAPGMTGGSTIPGASWLGAR